MTAVELGEVHRELPRSWRYRAPSPNQRMQDPFALPPLTGEPHAFDLGGYERSLNVSNVDNHPKGREYFNIGLRLMLSYQHEIAAKYLLACLQFSPHCALAHGLIALCHSPNYNFKGEAYYVSANHPEDVVHHDLLCLFPSQQVADRHSKMAVDKIDELRRYHKGVGGATSGSNGMPLKSSSSSSLTSMTSGTSSNSNKKNGNKRSKGGKNRGKGRGGGGGKNRSAQTHKSQQRQQQQQQQQKPFHAKESQYHHLIRMNVPAEELLNTEGTQTKDAPALSEDAVESTLDVSTDQTNKSASSSVTTASEAGSFNESSTDEPAQNPQQQQQAPTLISDVEVQLLLAIRILTCNPGLNHELSDDIVGCPYADAMRRVYNKYPDDPEVAYCFAEALMVLNAWQLYEYPTGKPVSPDVEETKRVLLKSLKQHPTHAGLCHMFVHLSEMSATPQQALEACLPLRNRFPDAGHLIHMPTHIDVLVGDYENCVRYNCKAIDADLRIMRNMPGMAGRESFYFGYIVHDYHMAVYGAILGGFEAKGMAVANHLNSILNEEMFQQYPDLTSYLESYSALDIHLMVRFGRWEELLAMEPPKNQRLMLFKACSLRFAQCIAQASLGNIEEAKKLLKHFDSLRGDPASEIRILHNNTIGSLFAVDAMMARGEIAYREGKYDEAFTCLRKAVTMQDELNYDEPWGKMQPIRHALGGLLLEQGHLEESEAVFRKDLKYHPKNPWALAGLIQCLKRKKKGGSSCCHSRTSGKCWNKNGSAENKQQMIDDEITNLEQCLRAQRQLEWADYDVSVSCACCKSTNAVDDEDGAAQ